MRSHCHVDVEDVDMASKTAKHRKNVYEERADNQRGRAYAAPPSKPNHNASKYQKAPLPPPRPEPESEEHDAYVPSATMSVWNVQMGDVFLSIALGTHNASTDHHSAV